MFTSDTLVENPGHIRPYRQFRQRRIKKRNYEAKNELDLNQIQLLVKLYFQIESYADIFSILNYDKIIFKKTAKDV